MTSTAKLVGVLEGNFYDGTLAKALRIVADEQDCPVTSACVEEAANKIEWAAQALTQSEARQTETVAEAVAAETERCAKVARDYASKARNRNWITSMESAAKAADHIAANIRAPQQETEQ